MVLHHVVQIGCRLDQFLICVVEAHLLLAVIYSDAKEKRYTKALAHLETVHALAPELPAATLALATLLDQLGREDEAEPWLRRGIEATEGRADTRR